MNAQRAPAAFGKHVEIAARLRRLDDAEAVFLAGHRQILCIVAGDLQEDASRRAALVGLPRRMQEARPEADAGPDSPLVANRRAHLLQRLPVAGVALDIGEQRGVVAGSEPLQITPQYACHAGLLGTTIERLRSTAIMHAIH